MVPGQAPTLRFRQKCGSKRTSNPTLPPLSLNISGMGHPVGGAVVRLGIRCVEAELPAAKPPATRPVRGMSAAVLRTIRVASSRLPEDPNHVNENQVDAACRLSSTSWSMVSAETIAIMTAC